MLVYIADSQPIYRFGLKSLLEASGKNIMVEQFDDGDELLRRVSEREPDIALVDVDLVGKNGLEVCKKLSQRISIVPVVALSVLKDAEIVRLALRNGAKGYFFKDASERELIQCVHAVIEGKTHFPKSVREHQNKPEPNAHLDASIAEMLNKLTRSELKILELVAQKRSSKQIANLLYVSEKSIENYRSRICKKLHLNGKKNALLIWTLDKKHVLEISFCLLEKKYRKV